MAKSKYSIYDTEQILEYTAELLSKISKALVAAAYALRDSARTFFENNGKYKGIGKLSKGIMLGRLVDGTKITLHGFGYNDANKETYKTRFFILGTMLRTLKKKAGKPIKNFSKGYIQSLDSIQLAIQQGQGTLQNYIQNALDN